MKISKKVSCIAMVAVMCVGVFGMNVSADVVGSVKKETNGGLKLKNTVTLTAEKTYVTPATAGCFGYDYTTTAKYDKEVAHEWILDGTFYWATSHYSTTDHRYDSNGAYVSKVLQSSETQFQSGSFEVKAYSVAYGNCEAEINVTY